VSQSSEPSRNLIQISNGAKSFGTKTLFANANFSINENERVGVIGPNGAGKSTLMKIICGDDTLDEGELIRKSNLRLAMLRQDQQLPLQMDGLSFITRESSTNVWEITSLLADLDLPEDLAKRALGEMSGGYRMRVQLCALLASKPDILLLDEPTNYLDVNTLIVLEKLLLGLDCTFMLISHDREFLRRTTDHILEVEQGDIIKYPGSIDDYFNQKTILREQLEKTARGIEARKQAIKDFAARFGAKATKARAVQSRLKQLGRMESIDIKPLPSMARINIPQPSTPGRIDIIAKDLSLGYGEQTILRQTGFEIQTGDKVAVVGENGAGKSTLVKAIAGRLLPQSGTLTPSASVRSGYYAQHVAAELPAQSTIIDVLRAASPANAPDQQVLDLAGSLLFSGDDVRKKIANLSGGEKARVALGKILLSGSNLLILDEPTNHLDFYTVEALAHSLRMFKGNVIFVSHDQTFVKQVATRIIEVRDGKAEIYHGSYDEYVWSLRQGALRRGSDSDAISAESHTANANTLHTKEDKSSLPAHREERERQKQLANEKKRMEKRVATIEANLATLQCEQDTMSADLSARPGDMKLIEKLGDIAREISRLESEWIELMEKMQNGN
jgi:ATP-binding cassette subfamily F protein 3